MPVPARDPAQVQDLREHLRLATGLPPVDVAQIARLAEQLDGVPVLPVIGAGGSYDCGMRLATPLAQDFHAEYEADPAYEPRPSNHNALSEDLGAIADAMALVRTQREVVDALGLNDPLLWPSAANLTGHYCAYRFLARLAREDLFSEAVTFNYDCGFEAALMDEGFLFSPTTLPGRQWHDHASVVADAGTNAGLERRGAFVLTKAHGCAARYREAVSQGEPSPERAIVLRWSQLLDWRDDLWARDILSDRARRHVVLLIGFSGQDPVIHVALTRVFQDIYRSAPPGAPRVVVIGHHPDTLTLCMLVQAGAGAAPPAAAVTSVSTESSSTTAITVVLLTEFLARRLRRVSRAFRPSSQLEARIAALVLAAPAMLRWSFLLRPPAPWTDYAQRINLEQAAERGYVPLMADPYATIRALGARVRVRNALGLLGSETVDEALAGDGFIVAPSLGRAYLPVGLPHATLLRACRGGGELEQAKRVLPYPSWLDCVLVGETPAGTAPAGVALSSGAEVPVP